MKKKKYIQEATERRPVRRHHVLSAYSPGACHHPRRRYV